MSEGQQGQAEPSGERAHVLNRRMLWTAYVIGAFGLGMTQQVNFLVPLRARELGASFEVIGLIVGAGALAPALFSVPLGTLIDRLGPRKSFILGTSVNGLLGIVYIFVTNYWLFLILQLFIGTARTLGWVASQGYITTIATKEERATLAGRFSFFSNVGTMVAPLIIGVIAQTIGFQLAFGFTAFYAFAFAVLGWSLYETGPGAVKGKGKGVGFKTALSLLAIRGMQVAMILTGVRLFIEWVWTSFFPVYLVETGITAGVAGTVVFGKALVSTLLAPTTGYWTKFMDKATLCAVGLGLGGLGVLLSPQFVTLPLVYIAPLLVGVGTGLSLPLLLSIVSDAAPDDQRGVALGLRVSVNQTAAFAAPVAVGPMVAAFGVAVAFGVSGGLALAFLGGAMMLHALDRRDTRIT